MMPATIRSGQPVDVPQTPSAAIITATELVRCLASLETMMLPKVDRCGTSESEISHLCNLKRFAFDVNRKGIPKVLFV